MIGSWLRVRSLGRRLSTAMRRRRREAVRDEREHLSYSVKRNMEQRCERAAECCGSREALLCVVPRRGSRHLAGFHHDQ